MGIGKIETPSPTFPRTSKTARLFLKRNYSNTAAKFGETGLRGL
jgi:hypothetical protein